MTDKRELKANDLGKVSGGNIFDSIVDVAEDAVNVVTEPVKEVYDTVSDGVSNIVGGGGSGGGGAAAYAVGTPTNSPTQTTTGAGQNNSNNSGAQQNNVDGPNSIGGNVNIGGK